MDDLIRRSDVIDLATRGYLVSNTNYGSVRRFIMQLPAVDAVEVVRCRECKYSHITYDGDCKYCDRWAEEYERNERLYLPPNFYCAWGKRREDGDA